MGGLFRQSDANLKLTERFTRVGPNSLRCEFTVTDPTVWTGARGRLSGARADEAATGADPPPSGRSHRAALGMKAFLTRATTVTCGPMALAISYSMA